MRFRRKILAIKWHTAEEVGNEMDELIKREKLQNLPSGESKFIATENLIESTNDVQTTKLTTRRRRGMKIESFSENDLEL